MSEIKTIALDHLDMLYHIQGRLKLHGYDTSIDLIENVIEYEIEYLAENGLIDYVED